MIVKWIYPIGSICIRVTVSQASKCACSFPLLAGLYWPGGSCCADGSYLCAGAQQNPPAAMSAGRSETWCSCPPLFSAQRCSGCNSQHVSSRPRELPRPRSRGGSVLPGPAPGLAEDSSAARGRRLRAASRVPCPRHMGTGGPAFERARDGCVCVLMRPRGAASRASARALRA